MLIEEIRSIKNSPAELRKFGLTMAIAFAAIGGFLLWRQKSFYVYLFIFAAVFLILDLFAPPLLKPVHKFWMSLAAVLGWFMTRLILITLFYLVLTPTALLMRLLGKDLLNIKFDRQSTTSYWITRKAEGSEPSDYEKQY